MTMRPRSLQGRLLMLVLGVVTVVWLAAAVQTWLDVRHELDELLDGHLAQAAALLVVQQSGEIGEDGPGLDAPALHRYAPKVAFQVFHEGQLVLRSANAPTVPMVPLVAPAGHGRGGEHGAGKDHGESGFRTVMIAGTAWRMFTAFGAERDVQVHVGEQMDSRDHILQAVLRSTLLPLAVALPLLALAAWWAVRRGVAPLRRLSRILAERRPQAPGPVVVDDAPLEMQPMIGALNGLFDRIGELMASERRFTADAAHELRTPIAAIRTQAQVALGAGDDAARRHALQNTLAGCDRAVRLVEQLLTLSRLEAGAAPPLSPLDLGALVRSVVGEAAGAALDKQQAVAVDAPETCTVDGDPTLVSVLVRNLVDNAIRYSPRGARIDVAVLRHGGGVRLRVQDSGPGLPEPERQRLGERFFRVLGTGEGGSGLGWSIVRRIAAVHHAHIAVAPSAELGGLDVTVDWPAA